MRKTVTKNIPTPGLKVKATPFSEIRNLNEKERSVTVKAMRIRTELLTHLPGTGILMILVLSLLSCRTQSSNPGTLDEGRFVSVYCALLKNAQHMRDWGQDPKTASACADSVLAKAGITRSQFDETVKWYNADVNRWKALSEAVLREIERIDSVKSPPPLQ